MNIFKGQNFLEFSDRFKTYEDRKEYLAGIKWREGFECLKCGHKRAQIRNDFSRTCNICAHHESATANTLFHKIKFDLLKAFYIVYFVSTNKKGITSTELARKLDLRQKTCWIFKCKVMKATKSSGNHPITGTAEVDETVFGGQEEGMRGKKNGTKKLVVVGIEKKRKGVSRLYARKISNADAASLGGFMKDHIAATAKVTTDRWPGTFENLVRIPSGKKGSNFPELHRAVMNLKGWLRGMHHHVENLQDYLDEYCYRFYRSFMKEGIFDNLMARMVKTPPCYIKNINV